jgi:hypothetical protein
LSRIASGSDPQFVVLKASLDRPQQPKADPFNPTGRRATQQKGHSAPVFISMWDSSAGVRAVHRELLGQHHWATQEDLAQALFEWIETCYNSHRHHSHNRGLSPIDYETANLA